MLVCMQHAPGSRGHATCKKSFMQSCKLVTWYPRKQVARNLWRGKHGKHGRKACGKACEKHVEKHSSPVTTFLLYTCKANLGWRGSLQS